MAKGQPPPAKGHRRIRESCVRTATATARGLRAAPPPPASATRTAAGGGSSATKTPAAAEAGLRGERWGVDSGASDGC